MENEPLSCPQHCHACCKSTVVLDLTVAESLVIYLLNRDVIDILDEYIKLHDYTEYCPFMIMDKCIINNYKPTACQMYMPFEHEGKPMCFYVAEDEAMRHVDQSFEYCLNSNCYDIHGVMMMIQSDINKYLSPSYFKNIYDGTSWWKNNYQLLPENTRMCLESILSEDTIGLNLTQNFDFEEALLAGRRVYTDMLEKKQI